MAHQHYKQKTSDAAAYCRILTGDGGLLLKPRNKCHHFVFCDCCRIQIRHFIRANQERRMALQKLVTNCYRCDELIVDQFFVLIGSRNCHSACLRCQQCNMCLSAEYSCYQRDGSVSCRKCFWKLITSIKCAMCLKILEKQDLVMQVESKYYHVACFGCVICSAQVEPGHKYGLIDGKILCEHDFAQWTSEPLTKMGEETSAFKRDATDPKLTSCFTINTNEEYKESEREQATSADSQASGTQVNLLSTADSISLHPFGFVDSTSRGNSSSSLSSSSTSTQSDPDSLNSIRNSTTPTDGSGNNVREHPMASKRKRVRTSFKYEQLKAMKELFERDQNPDSFTLTELSLKIGLTKRILQVWFQNSRAKYRKEQSILDGGSSIEELSITNDENDDAPNRRKRSDQMKTE